MSDYYIPKQGSSLDVEGHLVKCPTCGRKFIVEIGLAGVSHNLLVHAICLECRKPNAAFTKDYPVLSQEIEKKYEEFKAK